jgi:hypothetical protein
MPESHNNAMKVFWNQRDISSHGWAVRGAWVLQRSGLQLLQARSTLLEVTSRKERKRFIAMENEV